MCVCVCTYRRIHMNTHKHIHTVHTFVLNYWCILYASVYHVDVSNTSHVVISKGRYGRAS